MFHRLLSVGIVLLLCGYVVANDYKDAKITKCEVTGETTIETEVKGKKVTARIWPYTKMTVTDANGNKISAAAAFTEGNIIDVTTSKTVVPGKEVTIKLVVKTPAKKGN